QELAREGADPFKLEMTFNGAAAPRTVLKMKLADFVAMQEGRLNGQEAFMTGRLRIEGDTAFMMQGAALTACSARSRPRDRLRAPAPGGAAGHAAGRAARRGGRLPSSSPVRRRDAQPRGRGGGARPGGRRLDGPPVQLRRRRSERWYQQRGL